jgi:hypothetical protein
MLNKLEDANWNLLLGRIKNGKCTPFLGAGVCAGMITIGPQIASEWAKEYEYPMENTNDLIRVAQFVAVKADPMTPKEQMCKKIKEMSEEVTPKYFQNPNEPHGVLADLKLPIYITTNYDDLMERALKSRGKTPIREICRWNEQFKQLKPIPPDYVPNSEKPLVFHLHGIYEIPKSLVLTEYDYLDFLAAISKKPNLLPPCIREAFTDSSLLFLGYRIADWDFHVLFRILAEFLKRYQRKHYSVQLVPGGDVSESRKEKALEYLDDYFAELDIRVYWQDCCEFAEELRARWEAFNRGTIIKNIGETNIEQNKPDYVLHCQNKEGINKVSILFLAADPTNASRLRLGEEFGEIQKKLDSSTLRDRFKLELPQLSVRSDDILKALYKSKPNIVHFSGHGTSTGALCIENEAGEIHTVEPDALAALFKHFSGQVNCVLLNACYSEIQAEAISKYIEYVIGMNQEIYDEAAIAFAKGFYLALGEGTSIEDAYHCGCLEIQLQNILGHITPVLKKRDANAVITPSNEN